MGDRIYIGGKGIPSKNIEVYSAYLDNNKRKALSISLADSVKLIKPLITNSNGQSSRACVDIEPYTSQDFVNNIVINDPNSFYNPIYSIVVSFTMF